MKIIPYVRRLFVVIILVDTFVMLNVSLVWIKSFQCYSIDL